MARITVEDCIDKFPSRFELVLVASNRARKLYSGEKATVEKENDKHTVIALREIAQETLTIDELKNNLVQEYQTASFNEEEELLEIEEEENNNEKKEELPEESLLQNETSNLNQDNNEQSQIDNITNKTEEQSQINEENSDEINRELPEVQDDNNNN